MMLIIAALLAFSRASASAHRERPTTGAFDAGISVIAHPRIDDGIEDVDDEIEENGEDRDQDHRAHHQSVVAIERSFDKVAPDARYLEDRLDDDRAGQQSGGRRT